MSWIEETVSSSLERYSKIIADALHNQVETIVPMQREGKDDVRMRVSYNGFTGNLEKIERVKVTNGYYYVLVIHDSEKKVTYSFNGVKLENVKFMGGTVTFGE